MNEKRLQALPENKRVLFEALRARREQAADGRRAADAGVELLRGGEGPAMALVHPVGGELFCYGELTRRLPPGYPVYGLGADEMLRGADPPELVALARHYLDRLERASVRPALVAGWSFGGIVAYEMARSLAADGRPCPVAVIDAMPSLADRLVPDGRFGTGALRPFVADLLRSAGVPDRLDLADEVWDLPAPDATRVLHERLAAVNGTAGMSLDDLRARLRVHANASVALRRHHPARHGPRLRLVWASETAADLSAWWRDVAPPVRGTRIAGDHYSLLRPPAVEEIARFLHEAFQEGGTGD
ncbi:thioesterase domain-containing protein [Actinomadura sp. GTD37]|uniref:thioesterase domain-containing protein n=1 Tax=Actinomadura sp. GTD37 TaxID=1778030 RepID=UPI0035C1E828